MGIGFGYGWFALGWGMPYKRLSDVSGHSERVLQRKAKEGREEREREKRGPLLGEWEDEEETMIEKTMKEALGLMERRKQMMNFNSP